MLRRWSVRLLYRVACNKLRVRWVRFAQLTKWLRGVAPGCIASDGRGRAGRRRSDEERRARRAGGDAFVIGAHAVGSFCRIAKTVAWRCTRLRGVAWRCVALHL